MSNYLCRDYSLMKELVWKQNPINSILGFKIKQWQPDTILDTQNAVVYFLSVNGKIVYVGQTCHLYNRIALHRKHLEFDSYATLILEKDTLQEHLNKAEKYFIQKCNPILNGTLTVHERENCGGAKSLDYIMKKYGLQ